MTVSSSQIQSIQRTWRQVCKDRGWQQNDRAFRLAKFSELLGRPLDSLTHVERIAECTKLMNGLKAMLGVSVKAGIEAGDTSINDARVLRFQIVTEIVPCLELYREDVCAFMGKIMADKNRWWKIDRPVRDITIDDLDARPTIRRDSSPGPSQLQQLQWTLTARLNELRKASGDTIHVMKIKAGVPCACALCRGTRVAVSAGDPELEPLAGADPELGNALAEEVVNPF